MQHPQTTSVYHPLTARMPRLCPVSELMDIGITDFEASSFLCHVETMCVRRKVCE